jgi:hypothetical protein
MHLIYHYSSSPSHYRAAAAAGVAPASTLASKQKKNQYFEYKPKNAQLPRFN